ncbi:unnamed protein product [Penicillium salamii]|nr:unnamed protein product [Penicillium salamii]
MPHGPDYWKSVLIVVPIVCTAFAALCFALRIYSRLKVLRGLRVEDVLMGVGLLCTCGVAACIVYSFLEIGSGRDIWSFPQEQRRQIALANWILTKFWPSAQVFVKISILILLRKLLGSVNWFRRSITGAIIFVVAWGITALVGNTLQCWPVQYFWTREIGGDCMSGQTTFFIIIGALSTVEDIFILCLPLPVVWKLQMPRHEKIELTILFTIGCLVCIFSILRIVELQRYETSNLTYASSFSLIWAILELDMAIVCGSFLLMKPVLLGCLGVIWKRVSNLGSRSTTPPFRRNRLWLRGIRIRVHMSQCASKSLQMRGIVR